MVNTKSNQQNSVSMTKEERKLAVLKAQKIKEIAYKLVVKIISWESGAAESTVIKSANKITPEEWLRYKKQRMDISTEADKEKMKDKLAQTYNSIKANKGFE